MICKRNDNESIKSAHGRKYFAMCFCYLFLTGVLLVSMTGCKSKDSSKEIVKTTVPLQEEKKDFGSYTEGQSSDGSEKETAKEPEDTGNKPEVIDENEKDAMIWKLLDDWKDAVCDMNLYGVKCMYTDTKKVTTLGFLNSVDDDAEEASYISDEFGRMESTDCQIDVNGEKATIWYYAVSDQFKVTVLKEQLTLGLEDGRYKVVNEFMETYQEIQSADEFKEAYEFSGMKGYYNFFQGTNPEQMQGLAMLDSSIAKGADAVGMNSFFHPDTAAVRSLNLKGGSVSGYEFSNKMRKPTTKEEEATGALVTYTFADGNSVEVGLYRTFNDLWFPISDLVTSPSDINQNLRKYTKKDYDAAINIQKNSSWYEQMQTDQLFLLDQLNGTTIYGTSDGCSIILAENGIYRPYDIFWTSTTALVPTFVCQDFDDDGDKEIAFIVNSSGTGISIDHLYMIDHIDGNLAINEYTADHYIEDILNYFTYTYDKKTESIQYYMNGRKTGSPFTIKEAAIESSPLEENESYSFEDIYCGDQIYIKASSDGIKLEAELLGTVKEFVTPVFDYGSIDAVIEYSQWGSFWVESTELTGLKDAAEEKKAEIQKIPLGKTISMDLNQDGVKEKISYKSVEGKEDSYAYEAVLTIKGKAYDTEALGQLGVTLCNGDRGNWYIVDLDTTDQYQEIAIYDMGPSDDPETFFLRWDGKKLTCCGGVTDCPENESFNIHGDGVVNAQKRLSILQTWWADGTWKLSKNGTLIEEKQKLYEAYQFGTNAYNTCYVANDHPLYKDMDQSSDSIMFSKGQRVRLTATDDEHWVQMVAEDGTTGWFYVNDYEKITLPDGTFKQYDLVTYLCMAD